MRENGSSQETSGRRRMLATGRKINGTWEIRTFMRDAANGGRRTFWESHETRQSKRRR
jgi:hypothetical protein